MTDATHDTTTVSTDDLDKAFAKTAAARAALKPEELLPINIDIPGAVATVKGVLPKLLALRADLARLHGFDLEALDMLSDYARATLLAHEQYLGTAAATPVLLALHDKAASLRELLMSDAHALAKRGLVNPASLAEFRGVTGYKNVASELIGIATVLKDHWSNIAGKTPLQMTEIDEARALGDKLMEMVGLRAQSPNATTATSDARRRAFTLFLRAYDEVRSGVHYLRRKHHDADTIAPSLYAGRPRARKPDAAASPSTAS